MGGWMGVGPINVGDILMGISRECIFRCNNNNNNKTVKRGL